MHRDLKPQNLLLTNASSDINSIVLKIADFGFARYIDPSGMAETLCGSPLYMAPEILRYEKYDAKADLWSVGCIMYEMLWGRPPYRAQNHIMLLKKIEATQLQFPTQIPIVKMDGVGEGKQAQLTVNVSENCKGLISGLLKKNPIERIGFEEFFLHPFLSLLDLSSKPLSLDRKAMSSNSLPKYQMATQRRPSLPLTTTNNMVTLPSSPTTSSPRAIRAKSIGQNSPSLMTGATAPSLPPISSLTSSRMFEISSFGSKDAAITSSQHHKSLTISWKNVQPEELELVKEIDSMVSFSIQLIDIFDKCINADASNVHVNLMMKAATLLAETTKKGKEFWDCSGHLISSQLSNALIFSIDLFKEVMEKISVNQSESSESIEWLLFKSAMDICKSAALDELLGYFHSAEKQYNKASFILESLLKKSDFYALQKPKNSLDLVKMEECKVCFN